MKWDSVVKGRTYAARSKMRVIVTRHIDELQTSWVLESPLFRVVLTGDVAAEVAMVHCETLVIATLQSQLREWKS